MNDILFIKTVFFSYRKSLTDLFYNMISLLTNDVEGILPPVKSQS